MNSPIAIVLRKELREMFRDKRVRSAAFIMPIVIIVMLMSVFGFILGSLGKPENVKLYIIKTDSPLVDAFRKAKFKVIDVADRAAAEKMIQKGDARLILQFEKSAKPSQMVVTALVDPKEDTSQIAFSQVKGVFDGLNKETLKRVLSTNNIPVESAEAIKLNRQEIQVGSKQQTGTLLVSLLPYLIVIWAFYGGMSIAGDLVAGEKDKTTLETLLITPVRRTEIVLGKFLALATVCLLSSLSTIVGLLLVAVVKPPGTDEIMKNGIGITPVAALVIIVLMLPTVALFASALVAVSSYAKNPREAQTYMTSLSFLVVLPGIFSQFIGLTDLGSKMWINAIPILNTANNIRNALLGKVEFLPLVITVAISTTLAAIALAFTVKLFNREEVLVRV